MTTKLRELLNARDEDLFSRGACHIYAVELKNCWPELSIKHAGNADSIGPTRAMHVYAAAGDYKIDVSGPANEAEYLESKNYVPWEVSVHELMKIDPTRSSANGPLNQWRHNLDPEFVSCASERARQHIEQQLPQWRVMLVSKQ